MNTRVDYLDTAKGIAIILVAVGHCLASSSNPVNRLILSFHMPLFFIVSGILMGNKNVSVSFGRYVLTQAKKLLIPQITLGICEIIFQKSFELYNVHKISELTLWGGYEAIMKFWFLLVFFEMNIIVYIFKQEIYLSEKMVEHYVSHSCCPIRNFCLEFAGMWSWCIRLYKCNTYCFTVLSYRF